MEQRPLRLGDILDDYCPRERRVTNHAIVAMIDEDVRQTRCTTCDAEHVYKGGKAPKRRKKETPATLYSEVLAGMPELDPVPILAAPVVASAPPPAMKDDGPDTEVEPTAMLDEAMPPRSADTPEDESRAEPSPAEEGPVHRPLIRAQLPRIDGHKEVRQAPDFTMRQPLGRGHFRGGGMKPRGGGPSADGHGNGNRGNGGGSRFAGPRQGGHGRGPGGPGRGGAAGGGFRSGQPRQGGGARKRSR